MCLATIDVEMKDSVLCEQGHELKGSGGIVYSGVEHEWAGASGNDRVRHEVEASRWVKVGGKDEPLTGDVEIGIRCNECPWEKVANFELPYFQRLLLRLEAGRVVLMERVTVPQ
jgi:hypothetical protein